MRYKVSFRASAVKELAKIEKADALRIKESILLLSKNPLLFKHRIKKIKTTNYFRLRVKSYRIVFEIAPKSIQIIIIRIAHRRNVYRVF